MKRPSQRLRWLLWPRRFGAQLAIIFTVSLGLSMTLFTYYSAEREANRTSESMRMQAGILAENLSATLGGYLVARDYASIENTLIRAVRFPEMRAIEVVDTTGRHIGDVAAEPGAEPQLLYGRPPLNVPTREVQQLEQEGDRLTIWHPIVLGELLGWVRMVYSLENVAHARHGVWEQNAASALVIAALILALLHIFMRRPITTIARYTEFADKLDTNLGDRTTIDHASIELEKLGLSLNRMSRRLADQDTAIQDAVMNLRRLAAFPQNDPNFVISLDAQGAIHYLNPAAKDFLGDAPQDLDRVMALLPPDTKTLAQHCIRTNTSLQGVETSHDGRTFLWTLAPVPSESVLHCYGVEISELKRAEEQAKTALFDKLSAEAASSAKSQFLAIMSHEIRTPMNGVLGMTELLLGTEIDDRQRRYIEIARGSAQSLLSIINDILDFSKIEAGKLELVESDVDVRALIEEIGSMFAEQAFRKHLELLTFIPPELNSIYRGDYNRLRQVLTNLVGNAMKFTQKGEILIAVKIEAADGGKTKMRFEVRDTGIGIPNNAQSRIFDSFSQADGSTTRHYGGTGLGLAICKQLVLLMGGEIGVTSIPDRGSTFWFEITLVQEPNKTHKTSTPAELNGAKVMIADYHPSSRRALHQQLDAWKVTNAGAMTDDDAIAQLRLAISHDVPFDAVIIDHHHESQRTLELIARIAGDPALSDVGLILPMNMQHTLDIDRNPLYRNVVMVEKPVRRENLLQALKSSVAKRRERPSSTDTSAVEGGKNESRLEGARVLVAEDNPVNQELVRYALEALGCQPILTNDGDEAVNAFADGSYDIVLMDCQMPRLDGYAATKQIRAIEQQRRQLPVPIIALTANAIGGDRERCLEATMNDYLSKPFTLAELGESLIKWLNHKPSTRTPPVAQDQSRERT